jgi:hypothetical protein
LRLQASIGISLIWFGSLYLLSFIFGRSLKHGKW